MMPFEEAYRAVLAAAKPGAVVPLPLASALGRVLARDVAADCDLPRFDNSAVDGYAVAEADLGKAALELEVVGMVAAGQDPAGCAVSPGKTVQVMTGAALPEGTVAIVMQEDVSRRGASATLQARAEAGRHIRRRGGEFRSGDVILRAGTKVVPPVVASLGSLGHELCDVYATPKVGLVVTGTELVRQGGQLGAAQVYESNSLCLSAVLQSLGFEHEVLFCTDNVQETTDGIRRLLETCDVIVSSGGVSVGEFDFVRTALCTLEFETVVPKVALKPGKPFTFAVRPDNKVAFGLPGNPMSALVTFSVFAYPYLLKSTGGAEPAPLRVMNEVAVENAGDRLELIPGKTTVKEGSVSVSPAPPVGSHAVAGLLGADCLIVVPPAQSDPAGAVVTALPLPWRTGP